jgi:hypothetical protein
MFLLTNNLVKQLQWHQVLISNFQLLNRFIRHYQTFLSKIEFLNLPKQLNDQVIVFPLVFLLHNEIWNVVEREEILVEYAFSSHYLGEFFKEVIF